VPLKVRDVIRLLEKHEWRHVRTTGNHRIYRNPDGRVTVVSGKLGDDVRPGTWRAILKQTGIEEPEK
jgi:predicted RNA binding protein YcfA (HicA-like mRNA interferase family)